MANKYVLISIPDKYEDKFINLIENVNSLNRGSAIITIEQIYNANPEYAAIPK